VPEVVVEGLRGCVKKHASELKTYSHEAKFEVKVTEGGEVQGVEVRNSTLHHDAMESCMMQALATLSIPPSALRMRSSEPVSGGESMRHEKGPLGVVQVAGAVVVAAPIILIALGVTLVVYVVATTDDEVLDAARRTKRTKKLERMCDALLVECLGNTDLPPGSDFGTKKHCGFCHGYCLNEGYWPEDKCPRSN